MSNVNDQKAQMVATILSGMLAYSYHCPNRGNYNENSSVENNVSMAIEYAEEIEKQLSQQEGES
ncbi:MAG: hypothetical protein MJH10_09680 [Epibacterium sp.]|nr:hypothetical protein [Epibacterium sp.]NQX73805.1 hypothetical protein [Epibacterium sp.]